ncbi:MAG: glycosyltransferase family 4 protein [Microgenomates group bacterium]
MRLLLASEYFHPHWTGIAKSFLVLAKQLKKEGHEITVLTTRFEDSLPIEEQFKKLAIIRATPQFKISRTNYSISSLVDFFKLAGSHDQVIINSPHSNILFFTLIAKLLGKKVTIFHQGDLKLPRKTGSLLQHILIERVFDVLTIPAFFLADRIATFTKDYARHSRTMKYFLFKFFAYIPAVTLPNAQRSTPSKQILIGFAGRFVEEKGFDILYKAMDKVIKKVPSAKFVFAGSTKMDYEPFYESQKKLFDSQKKHVKYLGLLDGKKLAEFYNSLNVFVISSRSDCLALTQMEAAHAGVPIVCTDIPGARMLVKETGFGTIVDSNDPNSLADGIIKVLKNREIYQKNQKKVISSLKKYDTFTINS